MTIKQNLEAIYCSLPKPVIEFFAPKSNEYQIKEGQHYSKTEFYNRASGEPIMYFELLRQHRNYIISQSISGLGGRFAVPQKILTFEEFIQPFIKQSNSNLTTKKL